MVDARSRVSPLTRARLACGVLVIMTFAPVSPAAEKAAPRWSQLKPEQQAILAPLREDWEHLEPQRKLNWVGIARRYPKMTAEEQARVQERMQGWARLTAEQRHAARDFFRRQEQLPPEKKQVVRQKWEEYQQLPEEKRRELAGLPPRSPESTSPSPVERTEPAFPEPSATAQ